ncbi:MAG: hypothetical protein HPY80_01580 [Bacteroidales bacterium]|jgi:nitrogen regulatory protein PII|nr:hypothetical protein [Bacteroidales bacterium]NPV35339.1 hypothetical protein [Bacteroidales bacterium]
MKTVFIVFNQALSEKVDQALKNAGIRGYSKWQDMMGVGSHEGEPHLGTHTWPALNSGILTIVDDEKVDVLLGEVQKINEVAESQGIHAFVWNVEKMI